MSYCSCWSFLGKVSSKSEKDKMWWFLHFQFVVLVLAFLLYSWHFLRIRNFWKKLRVPHTKPQFLLGDFQRGGFSNNMGVLFKKFYEEFPDERFFGIWMFTNPVLIVRDPELIKEMLVKDFNHFHDRGVYYNEKDDPLSAHLFSIEDARWKNLRMKLSPTFTSNKMKMMFPLMVQCSEELKQYLKASVERGETKVNMKEVAAMFMTDVISLCAFGIETNSLKNKDAEFRKMGKKFQEPSLWNLLLYYLQFSAPELLGFFKPRVLSKESSDFFLRAVRDVMDNRKKNGIRRSDFMQLLMDLEDDGITNDADNEHCDDKKLVAREKLSFEEVAAEAFVFFLGGFETSSSTVQFAMYELAKNAEIQNELRQEILKSLEKYNGNITYEGIRDIPYLDQVIDETLRKYPVVPTLQRECSTNYKIPRSNVILPKGTLVHIPIYGIQMDEKYFPCPEIFDPGRFSEKEKQRRHGYTYLPFGEGPRNCIGKRFGQFQVRLALTVLLQNFQFELSEESGEPITFDPKTFVLTHNGGGNFLKVRPIS